MAKSVFISYCHKQGEWVIERLLPVLQAAGCREIFIDRERFKAGHGVYRQMDANQDQAETSLLVLSPDYLASEPCQHEMTRALARDPTFAHGTVLPVIRVPCDMSALKKCPDPALSVDLSDDTKPAPWALLLKSLDAMDLCAQAPDWLAARDECVRRLRGKQSVNLVVYGDPNWRALLDHLGTDCLPDLAVVDLDHPETISREGLVARILTACGHRRKVPRKPRDLAELAHFLSASNGVTLAFRHFEHVASPERNYGLDLFNALRHFVSDERKLVLLVESRTPFRDLLPRDHLLSRLQLHSVELRGLPG